MSRTKTITRETLHKEFNCINFLVYSAWVQGKEILESGTAKIDNGYRDVRGADWVKFTDGHEAVMIEAYTVHHAGYSEYTPSWTEENQPELWVTKRVNILQTIADNCGDE